MMRVLLLIRQPIVPASFDMSTEANLVRATRVTYINCDGIPVLALCNLELGAAFNVQRVRGVQFGLNGHRNNRVIARR